MIRFAGAIKGKNRHPYIYVIAKRHCLYIGETQQHPVSRWGQHLSPTGSFLKRLKEADEDVWASTDEVLFLCIDCEIIASIAPEEQKIVSQYVEHKLHERCILNLPQLAPIEKIISDTTRTAPSRCRYEWSNSLALEIYETILLQLKQYC